MIFFCLFGEIYEFCPCTWSTKFMILLYLFNEIWDFSTAHSTLFVIFSRIIDKMHYFSALDFSVCNIFCNLWKKIAINFKFSVFFFFFWTKFTAYFRPWDQTYEMSMKVTSPWKYMYIWSFEWWSEEEPINEIWDLSASVWQSS